jgi:hypothetical protein
MGFGPHPANRNVAEIANEIAIARALSELANRLLAAAVQYLSGHLRARGETVLITVGLDQRSAAGSKAPQQAPPIVRCRA